MAGAYPCEKEEDLVDIRTEKVDGVIYMMASPTFEHTTTAYNICTAANRALGRGPCFASIENVDFKFCPECEDESRRGDYVVPDIMIICNRKLIKGGAYYGVPSFIAEVLSPSTAKRDRTTKMRIYEAAGVSEYWIVTPSKALEIYYLKDGKYDLEDAYIYCDEKEDERYNADDAVTLREFPQVSMTLRDVFEDYV